MSVPGMHDQAATSTYATTAMEVDQQTITSASENDPNPPVATGAVTEAILDQEPQKDLSNKGELLFQSLFEVKNTPPGSPGSATSSSTLVNPQSRKVSPTAVKDFAYPSSDSNRVLDPVAIIEETTKKELLKQLKKKTAAEEKTSRKAVKLTARIKAVSAELKLVKANVQNSEAQADLAKTHANAMTLSNVVLREAVQEISLELSREKNISQLRGTQSQGEAAWDQQKEESLQNHLEMVDEVGANVYHDIANLLNASVQRDQTSDDTEDQEPVQQANVPLPTDDDVESNEFGSSAVGVHGQKAIEEPQAKVAGSNFAGGANEESLAEVNGEELNNNACTDEDTEEEQVGNVSCPAEESEEEKIEDGTYPVEETTKKFESNVEWIFPGLKPKDCAVGKGQNTVDPIAADFEDAIPDQDGFSESSGEEQESEVDDDDSTPTVEDTVSGSDCDEYPTAQEPATESQDHVQGLGIDSTGEISGDVEFAEAAGPATLWGILESDQVEDEAAAHEEVADVPGAEASGPATVWGILRSDRESSSDDFSDEELEDKAEEKGSFVPDESESNGFAGSEDQDDAELLGLPHDRYPPDFNGDANIPCDANDSGEEIMEPATTTTAPVVEEDMAPSPHGSVDGDKVALQDIGIEEVAVEETVEAVGLDSPDDALEAVAEPIGNLKGADEDEYEVDNGVAETVHLQESVISVGTNTPIGAIEEVNEYFGNATVVQEEGREEDQAAQEADASEAQVISEQPKDNCEDRGFEFSGDDAIVRALPEEKQGPEEGETLAGPAVACNMRVTCEEVTENESNEDHKLHDVAIAGPSITTAECGDANSGVVHPQPATLLDTLASPSGASPPYQAEVFEFINPMPKAKEISKTEKRKLERRRAAAKKADEAALERRMEEEAAKTPEALAQRQAEEDTRLGEKRLKLQAARMQERLEKEANVPGAK